MAQKRKIGTAPFPLSFLRHKPLNYLVVQELIRIINFGGRSLLSRVQNVHFFGAHFLFIIRSKRIRVLPPCHQIRTGFSRRRFRLNKTSHHFFCKNLGNVVFFSFTWGFSKALSLVGESTFSRIILDEAKIFPLTSLTDVGDLSLINSPSRNPSVEFCLEMTGVAPPLPSLSPPLPTDVDRLLPELRLRSSASRARKDRISCPNSWAVISGSSFPFNRPIIYDDWSLVLPICFTSSSWPVDN